MAFLSDLLGKAFDASGIQGVQGTTSSVQGVQGTQGAYGTVGTAGTTLLTNTQSGTYTLQASDVGKVVSGITTVGIPSDVFNPGENIIILNNESNYSNVRIDIAGASPVVSIYESGVVGVLTETKRVKQKSFVSVFCTRVNEFILSNIFNDVIDATGGTIIDSDGYRIHVFTGTGPFNVSHVPTNPLTSSVEYLVVAGGGGVNALYEGGGGAGGFRTGTGFPVTVQDYTITVGGGGPASATNGSNSVFDSITSAGGGYGGYGGAGTGGPGGSGGGGGIPGSVGGTGNTPPVSPPQGNNGGNGDSRGGGGGGGAGGAGSPAPRTTGGPGGDGLPVSWVPASYGTPGPSPGRWFAGGGAGVGLPFGNPGGTGGSGGGGPGGLPTATPGTVNTGGGGGAGNSSGGSGIVIIRYLIE